MAISRGDYAPSLLPWIGARVGRGTRGG